MMMLSKKGLELIKHFEGFSHHTYICPGGYRTIGYGHLMRDDEDYSNGITEFEGECLLHAEIFKDQLAVLRLIQVPLTQGQFDALVSFVYNLGSGALQRSTLRRKINKEEHDEVPAELMKWVWAGGRKLNGLIRRRRAEGRLYMS
jgi:lysozyme